jgi:SAM-dependent methyltransferase
VKRGDDLIAWIASLPVASRDAIVEEWLGIGEAPSTSPGAHLVGHHASGVDAIVEAVRTVPIGREDVVVDLGAGLGKAALLIHLLTGARVRGIEIQPSLVVRARETASRLGLDVEFVEGDVPSSSFDDATVLFLYSPFDGPVLAQVARRMRGVRVCALGVDLDRVAPSLVRRPTDSFWLAFYDPLTEGIGSSS